MLPKFLRLDLRNYSNFFKDVSSRRYGSLRFFWRKEKKEDVTPLLTQSTTQEGLIENNYSQSKEFTSSVSINTQHCPTRFAIIVKKKHGDASERVKTKRLVRHAIISLYHQYSYLFNTPQSVVVLVQGKQQSQKEYEKNIKTFLQEQVK